MIVAVIAVRVMQVAVHEIVDVIAVRHCFVPTARTMLVSAADIRRAALGIGRTDPDDMLVDMVAMHVMQMPLVKIIDVSVMAHGRMAAAGAMLMRVIRVMFRRTGGHDRLLVHSAGKPTYLRSAACRIALCTKCRT